MTEREVLDAFAALSQETRLRIFRLLLRSGSQGLPAGAIGEAVAASSSNLSFHLTHLERAGLIASRREARSIIYSANAARASRLGDFLREDFGSETAISVLAPAHPGEQSRSRNVLFLCSGNSARSIMAEAILRKDGGGRFTVFSAGSRPRAAVDPMALEVLTAHGYPTMDLAPKDWLVFSEPGAPPIDIALTICDVTAGEPCPHWPGNPVSAHWGISDPASVDTSQSERRAAFIRAFRLLQKRIAAFLALPFDQLDAIGLSERLSAIGTMEGASIKAILPFAAPSRSIKKPSTKQAKAS
jgi:ArsR family transcriptional regulator, arsenate/arsenite/antimonite-responsive transcriptional repressor / arsenate reductase (thioredoxin)